MLISSLIFLVILLRSDWRTALVNALPVALICMIGYLINDLHDVEKDRENHPDRALPRGTLSAPAAATLFFGLLAACLLLIRLAIPPEAAFIYLVGLLAIINYNYVVAYLCPLKNAYAAAVTILPLFIIWEIAHPPHALTAVAPALFLNAMGTEMLSDVKDHKGDGATLAKALGLNTATQLAFGSKVCGGLILLLVATSVATVLAALAILALEAVFVRLWWSGADRSVITKLMPAQVAIGACFVL